MEILRCNGTEIINKAVFRKNVTFWKSSLLGALCVSEFALLYKTYGIVLAIFESCRSFTDTSIIIVRILKSFVYRFTIFLLLMIVVSFDAMLSLVWLFQKFELVSLIASKSCWHFISDLASDFWYLSIQLFCSVFFMSCLDRRFAQFLL